MAFSRDRSIKNLRDGKVLRFGDSNLFDLLDQQRDQCFLNLHVAGKPDKFQAQLRHLREGNGEVPSFAVRRCRRRSAILQLRELAVHLLDSAAECDHLRVRFRREVAHYLHLDFSCYDLAPQAGGRLDRPPGLLLEHHGTIPLLEAAKRLFGSVELGFGARELFCEEDPLPARLAEAVLPHKVIEPLHVEVRHRGRDLGIGILHFQRYNPFSRDRHRRVALKGLEGILLVALPIARLKPEPLEHKLRHRPALEDTHQQVAVRRERGHGQQPRHLLK